MRTQPFGPAGYRAAALMLSAIVLTASACGSDGSAATSTSTSTVAVESEALLGLELTSSGGNVESLVVTVTLTNETSENVTVVRPSAPYYFVRFEVVDEDISHPYLGELAKLQPLGDEFFVELAPGASVSEDIDLQPFYRLPAGTYQISAEYINPRMGPHEGARALTFEIGDGPRSEAHDVQVSA